MTAPNDATNAQIRAADPVMSTWVSANAGSGKTRVLTDRVARLLLNEVPPGKILCLTYTKAAAGHMQNQLFSRLGAWSMLEDADLGKRLVDLGEDPARLSADFLNRARTLFALALETPGGLKIQTIHSFCAALLRRFPLEARVSPAFHEMDEQTARLLRADVLEDLASRPDTAPLDRVAKYLTRDDPDKLLENIVSCRALFQPPPDRAGLLRALAMPENLTLDDIPLLPFDGTEAALLAAIVPILSEQSKTMQVLAATLAGLDISSPTWDQYQALCRAFLYASGEAIHSPKPSAITKKAIEALGGWMEPLAGFAARIEAAKSAELALATIEKSEALIVFADQYLGAYDAEKSRRGWLEFDDLISAAGRLLGQSSMAEWVLFKLDGGIDHILVDEAQDTSPQQWDVISRLAEEFLAGEGARDVDRTVFVVGDEKQSIYSFQGADPDGFDRMRAHFRTRLHEAEKPFRDAELLYSFRSSAAILELVDTVFDAATDQFPGTMQHRAFHAGLPGRVDILPFVEKPDEDTPGNWYDPIDAPRQNDPAIRLARDIADQIDRIVAQETLVPVAGEPTTGRKVRFGDFLILVQRRSDVFAEIIKALKDKGLPVAGADRMKIGGELAVRDLVACLNFIATPEDDLSLAAALRSPLLGHSEQDLYHLAQPRRKGQVLWQALRDQAETFPDTLAILNDLLKEADFLRPFELLQRILIRHDGRRNLIARLGREAEDGIDALLSQALIYETVEPPSLTGFLGWVDTDDSDLKRRTDSETDEIRVMTVHGAKGLESPIVILPDTAERKSHPRGEILSLGGVPVWRSARDDSPTPIRAAQAAETAAESRERLRLLYVALTRAETWLIVAGAGNQGKSGSSWYSIVGAALAKLDAVETEDYGRTLLRHQRGPWPEQADDATPVPHPGSVALPDWANTPVAAAAATPKPLSPSDLGGAKFLPGADDLLTEEDVKARGRRLHLLLEHLAGIAKADRPAMAEQLIGAAEGADLVQELAEVGAILDTPELLHLFAPGTLAEVPITAPIGDHRLEGIIDRLIVAPDRILAVDFKSNAIVPDRPEDTPEGLLRQMGAYAAALVQIWPDHKVETAILWTRTAKLMPLPHDIVTEAFQRATIS